MKKKKKANGGIKADQGVERKGGGRRGQAENGRKIRTKGKIRRSEKKEARERERKGI